MLQIAESLVEKSGGRSANKLLARLPAEDYERIRLKLKDVPLRFGQVLQTQDERIAEVVFPAGGACSLTKRLGDGGTSEVAIVGSEGVVGASVYFGDDVSTYGVAVEVPSAAAQTMSTIDFIEEMSRRGPFYNLVIRYNQALLTLLVQTTACSCRHTTEQRCCRWLLTMSDRVESEQLTVTHEFLSLMLGVRRPTVTLAMSALQRKGIIETHRRSVTIVDRAALEATACECYFSVKTAFARLLPDIGPVLS
jgi:CRP-like cAMP-binding protein